MLIKVYLIDDDDSEILEASNVTLASCFPDPEDEDIATVLADLNKNGVAYYGGGAAPLFKFVTAA
jgi:hypothetical protein